MAFGLSFGMKKQKTDTKTTVDKTEATSQAQSSDKSSFGTTSSQGFTQGSTSGTGQQASATSGTNKTTGTTTGTTTQTTTAFSDPVLQGIEKAVSELFGSVGGKPQISNFDPKAFVANGVAAATADIDSQLQSNVNQLVSNVGGGAGSNSMTALLANRLRNDAAAEKSGINANLTREAEAIQRENRLASNQITATDQGFLGNLLSSLRGGRVTTVGQESQQMSQNQQTQQIGNTSTAEQQQQQQLTQQVQTQQLTELLNQLMTGITNTKGTEHTKGTVSSKGGGASLSL